MPDQSTDAKKPGVNIGFLYFYCNDIAACQDFYTNLLGMEELTYVNDKEWGWLMYQCEGLQFIILRAEKPLDVHADWAPQPGWGGGKLGIPSWSVMMAEELFADSVKRLQQADVEKYYKAPIWTQDSYWCFPVRDPMGNTIEVGMSPAKRPDSTDWLG